MWDGLPLHPESKTVKAALIALSADMPALQKVSQFVSHKADYGCSRCKFKAEREPSMRGSSGKMSYLTSIMAPNRTMEETTSQSKEYLLAKSKTEALSIQKKNVYNGPYAHILIGYGIQRNQTVPFFST